MKNKTLKFIFVPLLLASLAGCGSNKSQSSSSEGSSTPEGYELDEHYYDNVTKRTTFNESDTTNFDDEITNGLNDDVWYTLDGHWEAGGTTPHNGVRRRNLFYTKDAKGNGYMAMKARGVYNQTDPDILGKPEGACIETKEMLGPGRYEVWMAAMPRDGGVSAFWTYGTKTGNESTSQNEIDIEIGGGAQFTNLWCTTWTTHTNKATEAPDVSKICYMNDGKIHKYTFDWYTNYGTTGLPRIDWFIDGQFVQFIQGGTVPTTASRLWLGIWLPSWAGNSFFIEDYMLVDRVSFKAFDVYQDYDTYRSNVGYSPKLPSESNIQSLDFESVTTKLNKYSNADFESLDEYKTNDMYGWIKQNPNTYFSEVALSDEHTSGNHSFLISATGADKYHVGYYYQELTCAYEGFTYDLSIDAKLANAESEAYIWIWYNDYSGIKEISEEKINITTTDFQTYSKRLTMPEGSGNLKVYLVVKKGSANFDNAKLYRI